MIVEIVSTGTELLLGQIENSTSAYLAKEINALGFSVLYMSTVGDNLVRMREVIAVALNRADIVITTGGLGPTLGDISKQALADVLDVDMVFDEKSACKISAYFAQRGIDMVERNMRQAYFPYGTEIVHNDYGTAPCVYLNCIYSSTPKTVIQLPGPPRELRGVFHDGIVPRLSRDFSVERVIKSRVLKSYGIGDSSLEEILHDLFVNQSNPTIALLAKESELHIRLTACACDMHKAQSMLTGLEEKVRSLVGKYIFATDDENINHTLHEVLTKSGLTVATAESCTGGMLGAEFTAVSGSSEYYYGGIIAYDNTVKERVLGVPIDIISQHGAVSEVTAQLMACNVRKVLGTDIGLATTGIAGPGGATPDKPVGLVYVALSHKDACRVFKLHLHGERELVRKRATKAIQVELLKYLNEEINYG